MRTQFVETLVTLAESDSRIYLLTADLGWSVLERFAQRFPDRFLNVGVAEQNMLGIATGLAQLGHVPFVYSIATFASMRCYEQTRNGPVLHRLPVRVVGIGGGFSYGHAGFTHYGLEDLTIGRCQPGLTVIAPADSAQTDSALQASMDIPGPVYFRLDKSSEKNLKGLNGRFELDTPELVRRGNDLLFLATGSIAHEVVRAADALAERGISAAVAVLAHLSFTGSDRLAELLANYPAAVTVEEGYASGGLGSLVAETIATHGISCRLSIQGVRSSVPEGTGSCEYLRWQAGLDVANLAAVCSGLVSRRRMAA